MLHFTLTPPVSWDNVSKKIYFYFCDSLLSLAINKVARSQTVKKATRASISEKKFFLPFSCYTNAREDHGESLEYPFQKIIALVDFPPAGTVSRSCTGSRIFSVLLEGKWAVRGVPDSTGAATAPAAGNNLASVKTEKPLYRERILRAWHKILALLSRREGWSFGRYFENLILFFHGETTKY